MQICREFWMRFFIGESVGVVSEPNKAEIRKKVQLNNPVCGVFVQGI